jgi:hypothetical protein
MLDKLDELESNNEGDHVKSAKSSTGTHEAAMISGLEAVPERRP